jgi:hypothetical protein
MESKIAEILNESIRQELLVSDFYGLFEATFPEDREFWYKLSKEELDHGAILQAERDELYEAGLLPEELVPADLEALKEQNRQLSDFLDRLKESPPSVEQSLTIAVCLEKAITETIFRSCLDANPDTRAIKIFQFMVNEGRAHIERILQHAAEMKISVENISSLDRIMGRSQSDSLQHGDVAKDNEH